MVSISLSSTKFTTNFNNSFIPINYLPRQQTRKSIALYASNDIERRTALGMVGSIFFLTQTDSSEAAYGDQANVFGKITNKSGFMPYTGEGFAFLVPSRWNPSKERDFDSVTLRYESNFDAFKNLTVTKTKIDNKDLSEIGTPDEFLKRIDYLLGKQSYSGETRPEGGFGQQGYSGHYQIASPYIKTENSIIITNYW
eukprot:TRINITY_DN728_c0_g1_i12.p1 TRINITY_DN728_c0_g1~~TRINITY_DN728_c0_g1_i12.p1  ORF type:complete len:226 (-),score=13.54 TRINITY_DN728_c0_g1_i12:330-920(-)